MFNSMVQRRKETMISVRLEGQDADVLNAMAEHLALSRSELIRNATSSYITMSVDNPAFPNPKIFFSRNLMRITYDDLSEVTIQKVAHQSFLNGIRDHGQ